METNTVVWLVKPQAPHDAESVAAMRRAIEHDGTREGSLASQCLEAARARGLSGEETYLFLAYQALLRLEETRQRFIYLSDLAPFVESESKEPGLGAQIASRMQRLARNVADLACRAERAATQVTRTLANHRS